MEKTIIVCDRCGKQIDKENKQHITSLSCHYCYEVCNECYKILYSIKSTKEKEYQRLINRLNKIDRDFTGEFKVFLGEDNGDN
jgi:predicted metal-binding protein